MKKNVGGIDRALRIIVGILLIAGVFFGGKVGMPWLNPWGWIGVVPLATALIGWCPPYALLGINTCPKK